MGGADLEPEPEDAPAGALGMYPAGAAPKPKSLDLDGWLAQIKLQRYAAAIKEEGYDELDFITGVAESDIVEMTTAIQMKRPHTIIFMKAWKVLTETVGGGASVEGGGGGGGAAAAAAVQLDVANLPDKYIAAEQQIRLGKAADAAHGLKSLLGVKDVEMATFLKEHEAAIIREFQLHGSAEDQENLRCVLGGTRRVCATGNWATGVSIEALMLHASARQANLQRHHIIALRMYTTSSFSCINNPLRGNPVQRPHPFAATTFFISEGIKLLRAVAALLPDAYTQRVYWRGMRNMGITGEFMLQGGTDFACVSTTASQEVAVKQFAASALPLVFKIVTKNCMSRGADIAFLSVFPGEQEALYPPLTYLSCSGMVRETLFGLELLVATVEPTMA
jgi:hypothetical protein